MNNADLQAAVSLFFKVNFSLGGTLLHSGDIITSTSCVRGQMQGSWLKQFNCHECNMSVLNINISVQMCHLCQVHIAELMPGTYC